MHVSPFAEILVRWADCRSTERALPVALDLAHGIRASSLRLSSVAPPGAEADVAVHLARPLVVDGCGPDVARRDGGRGGLRIDPAR